MANRFDTIQMPNVSQLLSQKAEIRQAPKELPSSILGKILSSILSPKIAEPILEKGKQVREFFVPTFSQQMNRALEESPKRTTEELQMRVKELDTAQGIMRNEKGEGLMIDPTGAFGTLKKVETTIAEKAITPLSKLINAIKGAQKITPSVLEAQSLERGKRAGEVSGIFAKEKGQGGYFQALGKLKGELVEKPTFTPLDSGIVSPHVIASELEPLIQEARKYKSAEEFETAILGGKISEERLKELGFEILSSQNRLFPGRLKTPDAIGELNDFWEQVVRGDKKVIIPKIKEIKENLLLREDIDTLFNTIQSHKTLDIYEKVSASNGLQKLLQGQLPQKSQLILMEDIFGKELIEEVLKKRSFVTRLGDIVTEVLNVPRSLVTSFDMSAVLRQGILFTMTKPKATSGALKEMFRQTFSPENFKAWIDDIPNNPRYRQMKNSGLYISDPTKISGGLSDKEERFMTNIAQKIPIIGSVIRASERAYVSYLNKLRVDVFTQLVTKFEKEGVANEENLKSLARFVNNATGRGDLGTFSRSAQALNTIFFSPRLIASRFNMLNPVWYVKQTAPVRKEAIKTMAEFIGVGMTILAIAKAGGAQVETDSRSTDFGKIRVGNVRWDIWGGFQQWVRVFSQVISGQRKTAKGEVVELTAKKFPFETRLDVTGRFLRGKLAPIPSLVFELMEGQKLFGEALTLPREVAENTIPLYLQDMQQAIDEIGVDALFTLGVPAFFGVGAQVYQEKSAVNRFSH